jgi:hypothetical protein
MQTMKSEIILCFALVLNGHCQAAIVYPKAPEGGQQIVQEHVGQLLRALPNGPVLSVRGVQIEDLTIARPHRWYSTGATDLASGHLLSAAKSSSWRYPLIYGTNAVGVAQLIADEKTGKAEKFVAVYQTDSSTEALRIAEQLPQIKKQDYEIRFLNAPAVLFQAIWLHGKSDDIIIPLPNTFGRWNAYQPYSESQMIKLLKPEAKKVLKQPNLL